MRTGILIIALTFRITFVIAQSSPVYRLTVNFEGLKAEREHANDLYQYTRVLEDPNGQWTYRDILTKEHAFGPNTTRSQKDLRKVFWVSLQLQSPERDSFLFSVGKLSEDHNLVDIYYESGDSLIHQRSGFRRRPAEKAVRRPGSYFWVYLPADTIWTVYIRVDNTYGDCSYCWRQPPKFPVSVYRIDPASLVHPENAYVLQELPKRKAPGIHNEVRMVDLQPYLEFYSDASCRQGLDSVLDDWDKGSYLSGYKLKDFPYDTCHWVRLRVVNTDTFERTRTLAYLDTRWKQISYFLPDAQGNYRRYEATPDANSQEAFSFSVPPQDSIILYVRYAARNQDNTYAINGSMVDIHPDDLRREQQKTMYKYLMLGGFLFFLIYSFLQLLLFRDRLLFYYVLGILGCILLAFLGLEDPVLFRFTPSVLSIPKMLDDPLSILAPALTVFGLLKFSQIVLDLKSHSPRFHRIANVMIVAYLVLSLLFVLDFFRFWMTGRPSDDICFGCYANSVRVWLNPVMALYIIIAGLWAYRKNIPLSGYFLVALLPVLLPILYNFLFKLNRLYYYEKFTFFLLGLFGTLVLFGLIVGARFKSMQMERSQAAQQKIKLQNELLQIESKALRAQMNPHFIFNCLNAIKGLIQEAAHKQAIHYLTLFSKFIRRVLQHSEEKQISLAEELEMSKLYIEMERLRFEGSFIYTVEVDRAVDTSFFKVPPMILQPFLENAIWHGLMHKDGEREVKLIVHPQGEGIICIVEDNGIGRTQSATLNLQRSGQHRSFGTRLILDRLQVNRQLYHSSFMVNIVDKMTNGRAAGTRVELSLGG
ncbi:histidine kinase [Flavilitoribacter nigricans]|nr:histidine kinase [Flavilitoribacter nigricans]